MAGFRKRIAVWISPEMGKLEAENARLRKSQYDIQKQLNRALIEAMNLRKENSVLRFAVQVAKERLRNGWFDATVLTNYGSITGKPKDEDAPQ